MKKLLTVLTVLTTIISYNSLYSQDNLQDSIAQEHLTFMDIPIDGKLSDFIEKMKSKGFANTDTEYTEIDAVTMKGAFEGKNVNVFIYATPKSSTVYQITVVLPERKDWSLLKQDYEKYKELLSKKYGKPTKSKEEFEKNACITSDYFKLEAVKNGKCNFSSAWDLSKGYIVTYITLDKITHTTYINKINDKLNDKEDEEDE